MRRGQSDSREAAMKNKDAMSFFCARSAQDSPRAISLLRGFA
jgi:hypothetical protein